MEIIESGRVYLRNFSVSDVDAIFSYRSQEEVARYQYWEPYTREQTLDFINKNKNSDIKASNKWNGFAIISKENNLLIGDCAIKIEKDIAEIGCNISPLYQGKGFAKEALLLLLDISFKRKDIKEVYGITDSNNIASIKLMESINMVRMLDFEEKIICKGVLSVEHKYSLKR